MMQGANVSTIFDEASQIITKFGGKMMIYIHNIIYRYR